MFVTSYKNRDSYGRTVEHFTVNGPTVAVVVTLPKLYAEKHNGDRYLVNDWAAAQGSDDKVTYYAKRKDAVAHAQAIQAREVKKAEAAA